MTAQTLARQKSVWDDCPYIEATSGKVGGAWVLLQTRTPIYLLFDCFSAGLDLDEFCVRYGIDEVERTRSVGLMTYLSERLQSDLLPPQTSSQGKAIRGKIGRRDAVSLWEDCPHIEPIQDIGGNLWAFKGNRLPIYFLFSRLAENKTRDEFCAEYRMGNSQGQTAVKGLLTHLYEWLEADRLPGPYIHETAPPPLTDTQ